ncbi:hypothetical protein O0I10_007177 [Lichtheimia ornata]|uniref:Mediator of RNA polymerase II transcription subunit 9 n=1 Tax=Lichtheimia ornata TaxID=688661 RepID=A0AAD7Y0E8_9FUNG|nr:uncharacterized protein O0I10_007177 [Lichtheimia ornata]KAJ8657097.1 hypothetical protein O0I10_007177 [Lichtheimia ornata]
MSGSNPTSARPSPTLPTDTKDTIMDTSPPTFRKEDFSFMRDFHQIIELMLNGNNQEEIGKAVAQMDERFEHARRTLQELPGLQYVKEEQEAILERETAVLDTKKRQLKKYMELSPFKSTAEDA